ncbi:hypothetical protein [Streptomyces sp. NPDC050355]|uniref:hypothetical protein n=1 Tax=Streptomyces sp. NPDC050355 TaxID=3365609 RepID=UPI0037BCAE0D
MVGIMRGGVIPAVWLAHRLGIRDVRTVGITPTTSDSIDAAKTTLPGVRNAASLGDLTGLDVLLVDDTAGSGAPLPHGGRDPRPPAPGKLGQLLLDVVAEGGQPVAELTGAQLGFAGPLRGRAAYSAAPRCLSLHPVQQTYSLTWCVDQ